MPVEKHNHSLSKLISVYEEVLQSLLHEADVDGYFYQNFVDNFQPLQRIVWVSGGSNKNKFAIKIFWFCIIKTQQRYILREGGSI